jgi:hypothetical protein
MKNFRAADKTHAGGDEKHDINFHWPNSEKGRNSISIPFYPLLLLSEIWPYEKYVLQIEEGSGAV